jgi:uncharacterized protein
MTAPERTCVGCGRKAPQSELLRFTVQAGALAPAPSDLGRSTPGRGAYTCRRLACFERAVARRSFVRVLKRTVSIDPALARLYTST